MLTGWRWSYFCVYLEPDLHLNCYTIQKHQLEEGMSYLCLAELQLMCELISGSPSGCYIQPEGIR